MNTTRRAAPPKGPPWDLPLAQAPLSFVDLEMTGLDASKDRVVEICVQRVVGGLLEAELCALVRPDDGAVGNEHVHGIGAAELASAPVFAEIAPKVLEILDGAVLVAHAAMHDVAFLEAELLRAGRPTKFPFYLDTLKLARRVFGFKSHALAALAQALSLDPGRAHRAGDDVRVLRGVFEVVHRELRPKTARDLFHVEIGKGFARPTIVEALIRAVGRPEPVQLRYRRSGKAAVDMAMVVKEVRSDLDPPTVLGYLLPGRGRRELRTDRILSIGAVPTAPTPPDNDEVAR